MTNQNNAAQAAERAIKAAIRKAYDDGYNDAKMAPDNCSTYCGQRAEREGAAALLSKLRAPVADAQPDYPGATVADRLDAMADDCAPGSQRAADLRAAAAVWRKHLAGPAAQPKRSPYNASGSLSEYGIFPECDATPAAQASGHPADDFDDSDIPFIRNDGRS